MLLDERKIDMPEWDDTNPDAMKVWADISREYAEGVSGEVRAVIGKNIRPNSIWREQELPALRRNPAVTRIVMIDPATMVETVIFSR